MEYRIGSFNLKNLGLSALSSKNPRDLQLIANIIKAEQFDVVALQEILSEGKALSSKDYAKKSILMHLGPNWDFAWADSDTSLNDTRNEGYAFIWNKRRLRLSTAKMPDGSIRTYYPRLCREYHAEIKRKPFYARFTPAGTPSGGPLVELRLLCIHAYYGSTNKADIKLRQDETRVLLSEIYPQIAERVYRDDMPHYTIVLGDYNLELFRSWRIIRKGETPAYLSTDEGDIIMAPNWGNYRIITVQDQLTTLKASSDERPDESVIPNSEETEITKTHDNDRGYAHNYDHFSYDEDTIFKNIRVYAKRIDAVRKYCNDDFSKYRQQVSDHIPIKLTIDFRDGR